MHYEFSKSEKKIARQVIETALQRDLEACLMDLAHLIHEWKSHKIDNRQAYQETYRKVQENDQYIARMYDDISGTKYMLIIQGLLSSKVLSEADLGAFSEKTRNEILQIMNLLGNDK